MENARTLGTILTACKLCGNSIIFKQCKIINSKKSELQNKTLRIMCAIILLLLHRVPSNATTFCAFGKFRETMLAGRGTGNNNKAARGRSSCKPKLSWWSDRYLCVSSK
jgi:hypothetical protein